jgi:putative redox protein
MATQWRGHAGEPATIRTSAGRQMSVGRLTLDEVAPIGRVVLRVTCQRAERDHLWASLTAAEARQLAADLLTQAATVERRCRPPTGVT